MLCTQTDVEMRLQIDFNNPADPVCAALIAAAQGHIEREAGRPIEADDYEEWFDGPLGAYLWLANTPINTLDDVTVDGVVLTDVDDYYWTAAGKLGRISDGYLTRWDSYKPNIVRVEYNGGYTTVPEDLRDICAWAAARAFQIGAAFAGMDVNGFIQSITLAGSDSVTYRDTTATLAGHVGLTDQDITAVRYYRVANVA